MDDCQEKQGAPKTKSQTEILVILNYNISPAQPRHEFVGEFVGDPSPNINLGHTPHLLVLFFVLVNSNPPILHSFTPRPFKTLSAQITLSFVQSSDIVGKLRLLLVRLNISYLHPIPQ